MHMQHQQPDMTKNSYFMLLKDRLLIIDRMVLENKLFYFCLPYLGW
jgi:hypothetical protein